MTEHKKSVLFSIDNQQFAEERQQRIKAFLKNFSDVRKRNPSDYDFIAFDQAYLNGYQAILKKAENSFLKEGDEAIFGYEIVKQTPGYFFNASELSGTEQRALENKDNRSYADYAKEIGDYREPQLIKPLPESEVRQVMSICMDTPTFKTREVSLPENKKINMHQKMLAETLSQRYETLQSVHVYVCSDEVLFERNLAVFHPEKRAARAFKAVSQFQAAEKQNNPYDRVLLSKSNFKNTIQPLEWQFLGEAAAYNDMLAVMQSSDKWPIMTQKQAEKAEGAGNLKLAKAWREWKTGKAPLEICSLPEQNDKQFAVIAQKAPWLKKDMVHADQMEYSFTTALKGMNELQYERIKEKDPRWTEQNIDTENQEEHADTILFEENIVQNARDYSLPGKLRQNSLPVDAIQISKQNLNNLITESKKQIG